MFRDLPGYDQYKCASPPRYEDHPVSEADPEEEDDDSDEFDGELGGEG